MTSERRDRVLHVITGLETGGAERSLCNLLSGGLAARHESAVLSLRDEGTFGPAIEAAGVPVHALRLRPDRPHPASLFRLRKLVADFRPTLIQGWMYHGNLVATLARRLAPDRPALAWNVRQSLYSLANEKMLTRQVIRTGAMLSSVPSAIIYNSHLSRRQHEAFGFSGRAGLVIPNGLDLDTWRPRPERRDSVRADLSLPSNARVVGHVARFHPMKDHALFVKAAVHLARTDQDVRFLMIGRNVDSENRALVDIIPGDLRPRFALMGERRDLADLMQAMDIVCLSSAWGEGFPNVLGEAMASGLPCVTTDVGDAAHVVADTGLVVPPRDDGALRDALQTLLLMSKDDRAALGRRARARIDTEFALRVVMNAYAALYARMSAPSCDGELVMEGR